MKTYVRYFDDKSAFPYATIKCAFQPIHVILIGSPRLHVMASIELPHTFCLYTPQKLIAFNPFEAQNTAKQVNLFLESL